MYYTYGSPIELTDIQPDNDLLKASLAEAAQNKQILAFKNLGSLKNYLGTLKGKEGNAQAGTRPIFAIEVAGQKGTPNIHKLPDGRTITGRLFETADVTVKAAMLRQMSSKFKDDVADLDTALKDLATKPVAIKDEGAPAADAGEKPALDLLTPPNSPEHKSRADQKDKPKENAKVNEKAGLFSSISNFLFSKWIQIPMLALMFGTSGSAFEIMLALSKVGVPIVYPFAFELAIAVGLGVASYAIGNAMWAGLTAAYGAIRSRRNDNTSEIGHGQDEDNKSSVNSELVEKLEKLNEVTSEVAQEAENDADAGASAKVVPIEHARKAKEKSTSRANTTADANDDLPPSCKNKPKQ